MVAQPVLKRLRYVAVSVWGRIATLPPLNGVMPIGAALGVLSGFQVQTIPS